MKHKLNIIGEEIFTYSLITYLILLLAETIKEGFVSNFFNFQYILVVVIISGIIRLFTPKIFESTREEYAKVKSSFQSSFIVAVAGGLLVYYKMKDLGNISVFAALFAWVILFLLSLLIFSEKTDE